MVALARFSPSNQIQEGQETTSVATNQRLVSPPRQRRRLTARLRAEVVEAYEAGQTSRQVAEELGLGRSTVLGILKDAGVVVRPQGRKY
jgi:DNA-binding NarL/FixJ family response regulator